MAMKNSASRLLVSVVATCLWLSGWAAEKFALQKVEFAKFYREITGKEAPEGAVRFSIDPKISKSGRDAYAIKSCPAASAAP